MEENKKSSLYKYLSAGLLIFAVIWFLMGLYEKRGWKEDYIMEKRELINQSQLESVKYCVLDNCYDIPTKENTRVERCTCAENNETVDLIYTTRRKVEVYHG